MPWLLLALAIVAEVIATTSLRLADGFTRGAPSIAVVVGYLLSFWLVSLVLRHIPLSVTYAVWSAVGTALIAIIGMRLFGERMTTVKAVGLLLIIVGVVAVNLSTTAS